MKRRKYSDHDAFDEHGILKDQRSVKVPMFCMDAAQTAVRQHFAQGHGGTGDNALGLHRPGFRVSDNPPSDELQLVRQALSARPLQQPGGVARERRTSCRTPHKASNNDAAPVQDMETMYRLLRRRDFAGLEGARMRQRCPPSSQHFSAR
jgi:hypothetical protein